MELTKNRFTFTLAGAAVIAAFILCFFLYSSLSADLNAARSEFEKYERELLLAKAKIETLKTLDIKKALITETEISLAIAELTGQDKSKNINFISITPQETKKEEDSPYKTLPIRIETESTYEELGGFLGSLDDLEKSLVAVKSFTVTADKEDLKKLKADLVINMYLADEER